MTTPARRAIPLLAAALALSSILTAQKAVQEPRVGVEFKPPKGWVELPAGGDRGHTLRLFAAPRAVAGRAEGASHTPILRVMWFKKPAEDQKDVVDGLPRTTPFRGLEDFAQRGLRSNKVKVEKEAHKVGKIDGQRVTAAVEASEGRVLIGQSIPLEDGEAAVCIECYDAVRDKLKKDIEAALESVAQCTRTAAPPADPAWLDDPKAWAEMDALKRKAARKEWAEQVVAATAKAPESGFKTAKSKYWTVLSAADAGFTKKAIAAAEAAREWCAAKMPDLAKEQLPAVLRIFDSPDHWRAYLTTVTETREYAGRRRELCYYQDPDKDPNTGGPSGYGVLFRTVLWQVFDDVDPGVLPGMPRWLDNGCWEFMRSCKFDGKKMEFLQSDIERGRFEYELRNDGLKSLWNLMQESAQPSPEDGKNEDIWGWTPDCARLLRWLWLHDGNQAFGKQNVLTDYVRAIGTAYAKNGQNPVANVDTFDLSQAQVKDFNKAFYAWRDAQLKQTNDIAIPLKVEEWTPVNEKWLAFNKGFKN